MKAIFRNYLTLLLVLLSFGVISTLILDFWATEELRRRTWLGEMILWVAFFFRLVTYVVLFISCRLIAEELSGRTRRTILIAVTWSLIGLLLAALIWWHLAFAEEIYASSYVVRFTPERPAYATYFEGQKLQEYKTLADYVLWARDPAAYTWKGAMVREAIGIIALSFFVAFYLALMAKTGRLKATYYAPFVSYLCLTVYGTFLAPWSFTWGGTPWVGDALLGAMAYNGLFFFWSTLWWGGLAGPAIWVSLIAMSNIVLLALWTRDKID